jgi:outer membrane protein assembly factor BamB
VGDLVIIGSDDDKVYALDASTGEQAWLPFVADDHIRAPLFAGEDTVYFYTNAGTLYALETEQGRKLWEEVTKEP